jgi:predicted phage tail protein
MSTVSIVIASTTEAELVAGAVFSGYQYRIFEGTTVVQTGTSESTSFTFPEQVAPGSYVASVVALNGTTPMGTPATANFNVAAPAPAMFPQPATLTVTVS